MDGGDQNLGNGGSRWNPTKEQIDMLEGLYKQGLRTPSAEQIQQITNRLREFGHIEGKNVFYWFQNHKARQRQKQKQENSAFFNRFFHSSTSAFPPYHNVVCSPCYIPPTQSDLGLYQQYPKVPLPAAGFFKRRLISEVPMEKNKQPTSQRYNKMMQKDPTRRYGEELQYNKPSCQQETLDLFPMHPTGILQAKNGILENENQSFTPSTSENDSWILGGNDEKEAGNNNGGCGGHPFFDFFCGKYN